MAVLRRKLREVVVRNAASAPIADDLVDRMPGRLICAPHHESVEKSRKSSRLAFSAFVPDLEAAAKFGFPAWSYVIEQIEDSIAVLFSVMTIVEMGLEIAAPQHGADPARIKIDVGFDRFHAGDLGNDRNDLRLLKRVNGFFQDRRMHVHLRGHELSFLD